MRDNIVYETNSLITARLIVENCELLTPDELSELSNSLNSTIERLDNFLTDYQKGEEMKSERFIIDKDAYAAGGSIMLPEGKFSGNWFQQDVTDKEGNSYTLIWTNVDWSKDWDEDRCDWYNPDYIMDEEGRFINE